MHLKSFEIGFQWLFCHEFG